MSIHIVFTDGRTPYAKHHMKPEQFAREVLKWSIMYNLEYDGTYADNIFQFTATEKTKKERGF